LGTYIGINIYRELLKNIAKTNIRDTGFGLPYSINDLNKLIRLARGDIIDPRAFNMLKP
jgi:hypothetical protein